jgi:hypothetical protein
MAREYHESDPLCRMPDLQISGVIPRAELKSNFSTDDHERPSETVAALGLDLGLDPKKRVIA